MGKLAAMFAASALGASVIAYYHSDTRKDTWWRGLGAAFGGIVWGPVAVKAAMHAVPWWFSGRFEEDIFTIAAILFLFGSIFWGLVGALQKIATRIESKGADVIAKRVGLEE